MERLQYCSPLSLTCLPVSLYYCLKRHIFNCAVHPMFRLYVLGKDQGQGEHSSPNIGLGLSWEHWLNHVIKKDCTKQVNMYINETGKQVNTLR